MLYSFQYHYVFNRYLITVGAITALCSTLMGSILPQPRILMAMARDGFLPSFFSDVNKRTQVPIKSTVATGVCAALMTFCLDVSQLAGMAGVGTLIVFIIVAISILILRYVPPDEVPLPSSFHESVNTMHYNTYEMSPGDPSDKFKDIKRRKVAAMNIAFTCIGVLSFTAAASVEFLPRFVRYAVCLLGGLLIFCGLIVLSWIDQDDGQHSFGHTGGFICPFVPLLPIYCILINVYLLINLGCVSNIIVHDTKRIFYLKVLRGHDIKIELRAHTIYQC